MKMGTNVRVQVVRMDRLLPATFLDFRFETRSSDHVYFHNQSAEGAEGLGIIRSNKVGETE